MFHFFNHGKKFIILVFRDANIEIFQPQSFYMIYYQETAGEQTRTEKLKFSIFDISLQTNIHEKNNTVLYNTCCFYQLQNYLD